MKIVTIVGARPQFIKASTVSRAILEHNKNSNNKIYEIIIHTGQHFDENMSKVFFDEMQIPKPDYFLNINSLSHGAMTGRMLEQIENILMTETPDLVLLYGDTNSTLAGALSAGKLHIQVAHVEAGLRSFNMQMPEEINRILTDRISNILFCPTDKAVENLENESYPNKLSSDNQQLIVNVGDVMYDAALYYSDHSKKPVCLSEFQKIPKYVLVTLHRQENTDNSERFKEIIQSLNIISEKQKIIFPVHPRTASKINKLQTKLNKNIILCGPVSYLEMIWLLKNCQIVMTDSGGLQKEAYFFKKPCITLREQTEWVELVDLGVNYIVGSSFKKILSTYEKVIKCSFNFDSKPYGNGNAAKQIIQKLLRNYE